MFALGAATRIYVAIGATDMRIGFDGLWGKIRDVLECDPASGHIFLFTNSRRNRLKLVFFDGSGLWVCSKRMEGGRLYWPAPAGSMGLTNSAISSAPVTTTMMATPESGLLLEPIRPAM